MTTSRPSIATTPITAPAVDRSAVRAVWELTKPGITRMVLVTTAVGFALAALARSWALPDLLLTLAACLGGTAFASAGANALNMWMERDRDALMHRTAGRPIPSGRLSPNAALAVGILCSVLGPSILCAWATPASAVVAFATIVSYVCIYTPLKPVTPLSTIVGAVPGALPPLIGFAAAYPALSSFSALTAPAGWTIVALMAAWQIPHFLAIAWMYKDDYAKGGHRVLAAEDPAGVRTARYALTWIAVLVPVSLLPIIAMPDRLGLASAAAAIALGSIFAWSAVRFAQDRSRPRAVRMFLASIAYLPLVLIAMVAEAAVRVLLLG